MVFSCTNRPIDMPAQNGWNVNYVIREGFKKKSSWNFPLRVWPPPYGQLFIFFYTRAQMEQLLKKHHFFSWKCSNTWNIFAWNPKIPEEMAKNAKNMPSLPLLLSAGLQTQQYASMNKIFLHQKLFNASNWKVVSDHRQFFDYLWDQLSFIYDCCRVTSPASVQYVSPFSEITQIHTINHIFTK